MLRLVPFCLLAIGCAQFGDKKPGIMPQATAQASLSAAPGSHSSASDSIDYYLSLVRGFIDTTYGDQLNGGILVARKGQIIYEKYEGFSNPRGSGDSITPYTPFHLASVSKTFTAMATLKLWEQGKIDLDAPVSNYLTGFNCQGVTVRMLLNHRSGIPKYDHYMWDKGWDRKKLVHNQDVLDYLIANKSRIGVGRPDRGFAYSNTNYALLALIIEKVSGLAYPDYLKTTFFDSLGMKDTYVFTPADSSRSLPSYYNSGRPYRFEFLDYVYGDKNVYSTVRDLLKWDQALRTGSTVFKQATLDAAYSPYSFEKPGVHNYGLGWRMDVLKNGKKLVFHNGWWHGNRAAFVRLLDEDVTIIATCNNDSKRIYAVREMADYFGDYMQSRGDDSDADNRVVRTPMVHKKAIAKKTVSRKRQVVAKRAPSKSSKAKVTKKRSTTSAYAGKARK